MFTPKLEKGQALHLHFPDRAMIIIKTPLISLFPNCPPNALRDNLPSFFMFWLRAILVPALQHFKCISWYYPHFSFLWGWQRTNKILESDFHSIWGFYLRLSGLYINWNKSFLYPVNEVADIHNLANILGGRTSVLPIIYLRMTLSARSNSKDIWNGVLEKCEKSWLTGRVNTYPWVVD